MDDEMTYRRLLATIDGELHEDDLKSLKFLCEPYIGTKKSASTFTSGFDIFSALEKSNKLSERNMNYLCELLCTIGRVDLASKIEPNCDFTTFRGCMHIDPFRVMLFKLSEELAFEELIRLRYLYQKVPKKLVINDGIDLLSVMLQHNTLAPLCLGQLKNMLLDIDRHDLTEKINDFEVDNSQGHSEFSYGVACTEVSAVLESSGIGDMSGSDILQMNISGGEPPDLFSGHCNQSQSDSMAETSSYPWYTNTSKENVRNLISNSKHKDMKDDVENIPVSLEPAQAIAYPNMIPEATIGAAVSNQLVPMPTDDGYTPIAYYKMAAVPRGYCIIIDNQTFRPDLSDPEAIPNLGHREGSDKDSEALRKSFERLKFNAEVKINLTDAEIVQVLKNISAQDHTSYDCFVCCILSHGGENHVFGVNGRKVQLGSITSMFRAQSCPSLARKPKLFFMASCRGKDHQSAVQEPEPLLETDRPEIDFDSAEWVPNEADFLFGYSTVVNYVSYRSKSSGTFYINELTKVLDQYAHREDLQTLLLRVNAAVSDRIYSREESTGFRVYKQTPAPQHTLTKQLKFL